MNLRKINLRKKEYLLNGDFDDQKSVNRDKQQMMNGTRKLAPENYKSSIAWIKTVQLCVAKHAEKSDE